MFLNHPNIIKMFGCFHDSTNIYIILEVGTGGQLYHQLKKAQPLPEARIAFIMKQVCEAVNEIHSLRIIHRDIKPENIVLHDVRMDIGRISLSCAISGGRYIKTTNSGPLSAARRSMSALRSCGVVNTTKR